MLMENIAIQPKAAIKIIDTVMKDDCVVAVKQGHHCHATIHQLATSLFGGRRVVSGITGRRKYS
jgi:hypothetical protein